MLVGLLIIKAINSPIPISMNCHSKLHIDNQIDNIYIYDLYSMLQVQEALHVTDSKVSVFSSCSDTVSALYLKQVFDLTPFVHKAFDKVSMTQEVLQD